MGSLAGAGTLGFLIPPSIILIIYGVLAETSILKLFIAGIVPGLMLAVSYMIFLSVRTAISPSLVPRERSEVTWHQRIAGLANLGPPFFLIVLVLGAMYGGYASPSEAASVGVLGAVIVSGFQKTLTFATVKKACLGAVRTTSMIGLIVIGAVFLSVSMVYMGVPRLIASEIANLDLSPIGLILVLLVFYGSLEAVTAATRP